MKYLYLILIILFSTFCLTAQVRGTGDIVKQERQVGTFDEIKISGAQEVILMNGDQYSVVIETNQNLLDHISIVIQNNMIWFEYKNIRHYDKMKFYVTAPEYKKIQVSGASDVFTTETIGGDHLKITAEGSSNVSLNIDYASVVTKASGASNIELTGVATSHVVKISGASEIIAKELSTESTVVSAGGASVCFVEANSSLTYELSGAATVKYVGKPQTVVIKDNKGAKNVVIVQDPEYSHHVYTYSDTTKVNLGAFEVEVIDGDTTKISIGNHMLIVDDEGNVKYRRNNKRFNGHWGGFELGINGYVTPQLNTSWNPEYDYLNLRYEKSTAVNLNIYEQNIALNKDKNMGLVTGIGMAWNNYRFSPPTYLNPDSSKILGYYMRDVSVRKTKLTVMYITIPLMYEIQTRNPRRIKRFHFGVGVLMSARVRTHTKIYFNEAYKAYYLEDAADSDVTYGPFYTPNTTDRNIVKNYNSFYLQPFKFEGMIRIGYGIINLWGHFGLNSFFRKDRGPELYTWAAGITIVGW